MCFQSLARSTLSRFRRGGPGRATVSDHLVQVAYWFLYRAARAWWFLRRPQHRGAVVVLWHAGRVLLIRTSYLPIWTVPGGGVEAGETPAAAARRELLEEIGLRVPPDALHPAMEVEHLWQFRRDRIHIFEAELDAPPLLRLDNREVIEARFVDPSEIDFAAILPHLHDYFTTRPIRDSRSP
jgi:8-oxo-dGTP pyrophosphatase MutT (NUDIX family)